MTLVEVHLAITALLVCGIPIVGGWVIAARNARMVDESALAYCGQSDRSLLINRRAHVNSDSRFAQNPANAGFIFFYDCRQVDLLLRGNTPKCRFLGVSAYDARSMPLASMVIDRQVCRSDGSYEVVLTSAPRGRRGEVDVSRSPVGTGIIRFSYMASPNKVAEFEPRLTTSERS